MAHLPTASTILCLFQGHKSELKALDMAFGLARRSGAILRVLHISTPAINLIDPFGVSGYVGAVATESVINRIVSEDDDLVSAARAYVSKYANLHALPVCLDEHRLTAAAGPAVMFVCQEDFAGRLISQYGRISDIIVACRETSEDPACETRIMAALLDTGKAVVLMPPGEPTIVGKAMSAERVVVAWDGSLQASRALTNALPVLMDTKMLFLMTARETSHLPKPGKMDAALTLRKYGIEPVFIELDDNSLTAGESLLKRSHELNADLLIMGAFGHSHIAERLMGGTSLHILKCADMPVLMTH